MTYQELPLSTKIKIKMICNRNNITKPSDIETAYNNYVEGRDIFEGLSEDYQRVSAFDNYLANGGHIYSGEDEDTQQMQKAEPNIFQRPDGSYFYQVPGGEEIDVTPINTLSEDNSKWTYTDASGRVYNPAQPLQDNYSLTEAENANAVERAINNYTRELAWREANDPASIALQGKYMLPAIGMSSLAASPATLPYLNTALASGFGAHGIQDLANGNADWQTALEVAPLASLAKPMARAAAPALEWAANGLERNVGLGRNAAGDWNGWVRIGNTEFRPSRTSANMGLKVDTRPALSEGMKKAGWSIAEDGSYINSKGERFIRNAEGKLQSETSLKVTNEELAKSQQRNKKVEAAKKAKQKALQAKQKVFDDFFDESGLDFSTENWESLARGHKMTDTEKQIYEKQAFPTFVETYRELTNPKGFVKLKKENGKWYGWFDEPVSKDVSDKLPVLKKKWDKGFRELQGDEGAMTYIIANSPQGKKLFHNGITMYEGVPEKYMNDFVSGNNLQTFKKWFDSNVTGAPAYANPNKLKGVHGLQFYSLPIKPSKVFPGAKDEVTLIKREIAKPSSNNWNGAREPIGSFLEKNSEKKIFISEGPLRDDLATKYNNNPVEGIFSIVGEDIPVKSVFGGTGMYDIKGNNLFKPFAALAMPLGMAATTGYNTLKND